MSTEHEFWVNEEHGLHQWECTCGNHGTWTRVRDMAEEEGQEHSDWKHP